jgi:hypothetical protein
MAKTNKLATEALKAPHGERMLEVRVRFWTNDIADQEGFV